MSCLLNPRKRSPSGTALSIETDSLSYRWLSSAQRSSRRSFGGEGGVVFRCPFFPFPLDESPPFLSSILRESNYKAESLSLSLQGRETSGFPSGGCQATKIHTPHNHLLLSPLPNKLRTNSIYTMGIRERLVIYRFIFLSLSRSLSLFVYTRGEEKKKKNQRKRNHRSAMMGERRCSRGEKGARANTGLLHTHGRRELVI